MKDIKSAFTIENNHKSNSFSQILKCPKRQERVQRCTLFANVKLYDSNISVEVQDIRSIHDRTLIAKNGTDLIKKWTEDGLCRYVDDKKITDWSSLARVYFPIELLQSAANNILRKSDIVNNRNNFQEYSNEMDNSEERNAVVGVGVAPTIYHLRFTEDNPATRLRPSPTAENSIAQEDKPVNENVATNMVEGGDVEKNREATETVQTVIAKYGQSPDHSYFRSQAGAVTSLDSNISQPSIKSSGVSKIPDQNNVTEGIEKTTSEKISQKNTGRKIWIY